MPPIALIELGCPVALGRRSTGFGRVADHLRHGYASKGGTVMVSRDTSDGKDLGAIAQGALRAGWVSLLGFESARSSRWAMVTGMELNRLDGQSRALLLLDSRASRPWACAHNVRIELQAEAGRAVRASPGFRLNCRHLTGEARAVRLRSLIVLRRAPVQD